MVAKDQSTPTDAKIEKKANLVLGLVRFGKGDSFLERVAYETIEGP